MRHSAATVATLLLLGFLAACSQHEYSMKGPAPQAPKHARDAHIVLKEKGAGMNAMPVPEDQTDEASGQRQAAQGSQESTAAQGNGSQGTYTGTVDLPPSLKADFTPGETLFIIGRAADQPVPVAAKKMTVTSFPVGFSLGPGDSMTGQPLPPTMEILARLDTDGNLSTQDPKDMTGGPTSASAGTHVTLTLSETGR